MTSRPQARRLPLAPLVPQKTVSSLPCPIVYRSQMLWLPEGSRFHMAHGRGVARLHNPVEAICHGLRWLCTKSRSLRVFLWEK
jgi:hypothetical protein